MSPITINDNTARIATNRETANRANATHSTGPKTSEGKLIVSQNALKHGLYSQTALLPTEARADFDAAFDSLCRQFGPHDETEIALVRGIHECEWRTARIRRTEVFLLSLGMREQAANFLDEPDPDLRSGLTQAAAFRANARLLDQLRRHENQLLREHKELFRNLDVAQLWRVPAPESAPEPAPALKPESDPEPGFVPAIPSTPPSTTPLPVSAMPVFTGSLRSYKQKQWLKLNAKYGPAGAPKP